MLNKIFSKKGSDKEETVALAIEGMTCVHCATGIEKRLGKTKGVKQTQVSYPEGKGTFVYDPEIVSAEEISTVINGIGNYQVTGEIGGMTVEKSGNGLSMNGIRQYDLVIIGGGSAAFSAAIKANDLGLSTLMVNGGLPLGGTCVNVGCVPSKNLIRAAETVYHAKHSNFPGIRPLGAEVDFGQVIRDKKALVATLQQKKYLDVVSDFPNLTIVEGWAEFLDEKTIRVNRDQEYKGLKFLIATGATTNIPNIEGQAG